MKNAPSHPDLPALLSKVADGDLTANEFERLEAMLLDDSSARATYHQQMRVHALLHWRWNPVKKESSTLESDVPTASFPSLSTTHHPLPTSFIGGPLFSYMAATVILCVILLGGWAYKISHISHDVAPQTAQSNNKHTPPTPVFVGRVTGMKNCTWSNPDTGTVVGALVSLDREYALASGLLEITYTSGARVILEGPCTYRIESSTSGYLDRGKLTARIMRQGSAASAAGAKLQAEFSIQTPMALITDLGTEFGVKVEENGDTTSHVFQGSVLMRAIAENRSAASAESIDIEMIDIVDLNVVLFEGKSVRVKRGKDDGKMQLQVDPVGWDPSSFVRTMPKSNPVNSKEAYAEMVHALHPAVYYHMEQPKCEKERFVVVDSAPGRRHGELRLGNEFGGTPYRPGRFGDSLWFRGPEVGDCAIVPDYEKAEADRLTVAAWVMASGRPGWAMIAANWGTPREGHEEIDNAGQFHIGLYRNDGDLCARIVQRNGQWIQVREGADHPLPTGVWQHVALVVDEGVLRLYRNGKETASIPCEGVLPRPPVAALGIGCRLDDTGTEALQDTGGYHYWQGRIDELAVFNRALSIETIRRLYLGKKVNDPTESSSVGKGESPIDGP